MPDYNPTFLKRDPLTGLTFYDFDGHITATGLDLHATLTNTVTDINRIRWVADDGSGKVVGVIQGVGRSAPFDSGELQLYAYRPSLSGVGDTSRIDMVNSGAANPQGQIRAIHEDASGIQIANRLILGSNSTSDFEFKRTVYTLTASGATGALGGAFSVVPGLDTGTVVAMTTGQTALLFGSVNLNRTANIPSAFWVVNPAGGGQTNLTGGAGQTDITGNIVVPVMATFTAPSTQNYRFSVQATCPGGGGIASNPGWGIIEIIGG